MILLNFSHPMTDKQQEQVRHGLDLDVTGEPLSIRSVKCQLDVNVDLASQVVLLADACQLEPAEWQTDRIVLNLPALSTAAALLLAELHGRCGYYPPAIRLKQEDGVIPPRYVLAEILDVNSQRQNARKRR